MLTPFTRATAWSSPGAEATEPTPNMKGMTRTPVARLSVHLEVTSRPPVSGDVTEPTDQTLSLREESKPLQGGPSRGALPDGFRSKWLTRSLPDTSWCRNCYPASHRP